MNVQIPVLFCNCLVIRVFIHVITPSNQVRVRLCEEARYLRGPFVDVTDDICVLSRASQLSAATNTITTSRVTHPSDEFATPSSSASTHT